MKSIITITILFLMGVVLSSCSKEQTIMTTNDSSVYTQENTLSDTQNTQNDTDTQQEEAIENNATNKISLSVNEEVFTVTVEENSATEALLEMLKVAPIVINMSDYGSFEKVGSLGESLPTSNTQMTTSVGDIVLYGGNSIVVFYGSNTWSYTKLGSVDNIDGFAQALGSGNVTITFSL